MRVNSGLKQSSIMGEYEFRCQSLTVKNGTLTEKWKIVREKCPTVGLRFKLYNPIYVHNPIQDVYNIICY